MEAAFRKSIHGGVVKEEIKIKAEDSKDDKLESAKADMEEVMEENQRLKMNLDRIMKDYRNLQMQFHEIVERDAEKSNTNIRCDEAELVSLSLGRTSSDTKKEELSKILSKDKAIEDNKGGLTLGLMDHCKFESSAKTSTESLSPSDLSLENCLGEVKDEKGAETWPPHKVLKTMRNEEDNVSQQNPTKRAKVSVRVRCDTPTMNDGCQWRKYGQKIAKGNPCPRAYYRCTITTSCPVRKQVQRCIEDMSILITTYEGTHNHPLPVSATSMAFTTSAAASMLLSGSSSSGTGPSILPATSTTTNPALHFYLSDTSKPKPFYLPNSSVFSTSRSQYPTITLDLTPNSSASSFPLHHRTSSISNYSPRYNNSSTDILNFSSLESNNPLFPMSWSNGNQEISSFSFSRRLQEILSQSYLQNINNTKLTQSSLPQDTIAAATTALASDPNFQSALAIALKSIIVSGGGNHHIEEKSGQNLKVSSTEPFPVLCSFPETANPIKCSSSFLNKSTSSANNTQPENLMFLRESASLKFAASKSKSTSPGDHKDYTL